MPGAWHANRFVEDAARHLSPCVTCGRDMWLPASKVGVYIRCSRACNLQAAAEKIAARTRPCESCGKPFTPRQVQLDRGVGKFCSQACNTAGREALQDPAIKIRAHENLRAAYASGKVVRPKGSDNPQWMGGLSARRERMKTPEGRAAQAATLRKYRKANPDKVRECAMRRASCKTVRLPRGTVKKIGEAQKWRCAICRVSVRKSFHLDHVMPLARGGEHAPRNLQILCQTCNVRKNAKDPIDYMQSIGRLI